MSFVPSHCFGAESNQQVCPIYQNCWESVQRVSVCIFTAEINVSKSSLVICECVYM